MRIGAMNHPALDPIDEIQWIGQNGFDFVDLTLEPPAAAPESIDVATVTQALAEQDLSMVAHTAYYLPIASPFAGVRRAALAEFQSAAAVAGRLGASIMTVHYQKVPPFFSDRDTVDWHVDTLGPLCEAAEKEGVTVVLENAPQVGQRQLENIFEIMDRVSLLGFHLDSGHAKLERSYDRFAEYVDRLGDKLMHVHLSDNDGTADQHLPLGAVVRNPTDWPAQIKKLKSNGYDGTITLEVFSGEKEHLLLSRDLLRNWWHEA